MENKGKAIIQSVTKDSSAKPDSLKMFNDESPVPRKLSVPNKLKMEKDSTKKILEP
jgi:hypothetical protein